MSGPDLEKPYQDAADAQERLDGYFQKETENFLYELFHTPGFAAKWVNDYIDDPAEALAKVYIASVTAPEPYPGEATGSAIGRLIVGELLALAKPYLEKRAEYAEEADDGSDDFEKDSD